MQLSSARPRHYVYRVPESLRERARAPNSTRFFMHSKSNPCLESFVLAKVNKDPDKILCICIMRMRMTLLPERVARPIINGIDDRRRRIVHSWPGINSVFWESLGAGTRERGQCGRGSGTGTVGLREQTSFINRVSVGPWL